MGYRSEVAVVVRTAYVDDFETAAAAIDAEFRQSFDRVYWSTHGKVFFANHIKWYSEYPVVRAVQAGLEAISLDEYVFTRIGEDDGDVEREGYLDTAYIVREVELPAEIPAPRTVPNQPSARSAGAQEVEIE